MDTFSPIFHVNRVPGLNHNSVLGIREFAIQERASVYCIDIIGVEKPVSTTVFSSEDKEPGFANHLFALPAECNFSGLQPHPNIIERAKLGEFHCL
jgi:hypothetical protein